MPQTMSWLRSAFLFCCIATICAGQKTIIQDGVSITYTTARFLKVNILRAAADPAPAEQFDPLPAPRSFCFDCDAFREDTDTRYGGVLNVRAAEDGDVRDFDLAYPRFRQAISDFADVMQRRPKLPMQTQFAARDLPTIPAGEESGYFFLKKVRYFDFPWCSAIGCLN
ncbi:MAG: hypothetical protein ABI871_01070 [Chthoniobacterales bacterium]